MKNIFFGRVIACVLCMLILLSCVACANEEGGEAPPSGMQLATAAGADFRLYVPTHWSANTSYGVSGGFYHLTQQSTVSMVKYPITKEMVLPSPTEENAMQKERADWFYENQLLPQIESMNPTGDVEKADQHGVEVLMDGVNAIQYHVKATVNGEDLHFLYVIGEKSNAFYVFSYTVTNGLYVMLVEDYVNILNAIRFAEPYMPTDNAKDIDQNAQAPEGMRLASNEDVSYRLYVPKTWVVDQNQTVFSAYEPTDRSNVSVVPYMPSSDQPMSVMEYFEENKRLMEMTPNNAFEPIGDGVEVKLGNAPAMCYKYYYSIGGVQYQYMQIIAAYKGMFYNFTYTAQKEHYNAHIAEVDTILDAFEFR